MFSVLEIKPSGECCILFASPAVETLLGYTPEEYLALGCVLRCGAANLRSTRGEPLPCRPAQHLLGFTWRALLTRLAVQAHLPLRSSSPR